MTCPECRDATPVVWEYARVDEDDVDEWLARGDWKPFAVLAHSWTDRHDDPHRAIEVCLRRVKPADEMTGGS
jgi:hypothetical protein